MQFASLCTLPDDGFSLRLSSLPTYRHLISLQYQTNSSAIALLLPLIVAYFIFFALVTVGRTVVADFSSV